MKKLNFRKKISLYYVLIVVVIILIDQWSKSIIHNNFYLGESIQVLDGFFNLTYVRNSGAAFGFGGDFHDHFRYGLFLFLPVVACVWIFYLIIKESKISMTLMGIIYSLILGGAIGNLIDRFSLNYVVDMFDFYYGDSHFATFNVADAAISVAAILLFIDYFFKKKNATKV